MKTVTHGDQVREEWRAGVTTRMQVSAENGAVQLCIFEQMDRPAAGAPTHRHPVEEVLTVIEGRADLCVDGQDSVLLAGQSTIVPAHCDHGFRNAGPAMLHIHAVLASPIFEATVQGQQVQRWLPEDIGTLGRPVSR